MSSRLSRRTLIFSGSVAAAVTITGVVAMSRSRDRGRVNAPEPTDEPVEIVYCAGWDATTHTPVTPMSESVARAQDAAGAQYAAVLFVGGVARAVVEVCWEAHHAEVWHLDDTGRRYRAVAYRRWPDGRLRLFEVRNWREGEEPVFRARVHRSPAAAVETVSVHEELADGGKLETQRDWNTWPEPARPVDDVVAPAPGGWGALAGLTGPGTVRSGPDAVPAAFPWRAPHPLRPKHISQMVTDGARFRAKNGGELVVRRVPAGTIRLPSGKLLVGDPGWLDAESAPLAVEVPPGTYSVDVFQLENGETIACRVLVRDAPVVSWHLGLRDGDHELDLGDGEFFGNAVDSATLALVDRTGAGTYPEADLQTTTEGAFRTLSAGATDMVIVPGWSDGTNPVWLGRTADGAVGSYVVDFLWPDLATAEPL